MILIHRITPFLVGLFAAAVFLVLSNTAINPFLSIGIGCLLIGLLLVRLVSWQPYSFRFWNFIGTPLLFFLSGTIVFLFFEQSFEKIILGSLLAILLLLYTEHVFTYVHLPVNYQVNAIEHLSLALNILTIFFFAAAGLGARMFLGTSLLSLTAIFLGLSLFIIYSTLWVSKVEHKEAWPYALAGAVLMTELFSVMTFLPTSFYTSAAILSVFFYVFLGITRAHFLDRLSRRVLTRYLVIAILLLIAIIGSAQWI